MRIATYASLSYGAMLPDCYSDLWRKEPSWMEEEDPVAAAMSILAAECPFTQVEVIRMGAEGHLRLVRYEETVTDATTRSVGMLPVYDIDDDELRATAYALGLEPKALEFQWSLALWWD